MLRIRRPIKDHSLRHRAFGLSALENREKKEDMATIRKLMILALLTPDDESINDYCLFKLQRHVQKWSYDLTLIPRTIKLSACIENIPESDAYILYRFRKQDIFRLFKYLRIPTRIVLTNRSVLAGEELLMFCLRRLGSRCNLDDLVAHSQRPGIFGRDITQWSRAFRWFLDHIMSHFSFILSRNLEYFLPAFPSYSRAISEKLSFDSDLVGFIDCTIRPISRPGSGATSYIPSSQPAGLSDVERRKYLDLLQQSFYSGYTKHHSIKFLTVSFPDGLTGFAFGAISGRRSDSQLLYMSNLSDYLSNVQSTQAKKYKIFGDSVFPSSDCIVTNRTIGYHSTEAKHALSAVRIAVEWDYGATLALFPHIDVIPKAQVLSSFVSSVYLTATLLKNCHTCCYGSCGSTYFNLSPPSLENYLAYPLP